MSECARWLMRESEVNEEERGRGYGNMGYGVHRSTEEREFIITLLSSRKEGKIKGNSPTRQHSDQSRQGEEPYSTPI